VSGEMNVLAFLGCDWQDENECYNPIAETLLKNSEERD
jgi:hypothetical protein